MISAQAIMYGLGTFFILSAVYLLIILMIRKSIWNYPTVASAYIIFILFLIFFGIMIIKQIEITGTMDILMVVVIIIWGFITYRLPARKEEIANVETCIECRKET